MSSPREFSPFDNVLSCGLQRLFCVYIGVKSKLVDSTLRSKMRDEPRAYRIVRFYKDPNRSRRTIRDRVTLSEAKAHCSDPETSSSTATSATARRRTARLGDWFDGFEER